MGRRQEEPITRDQAVCRVAARVTSLPGQGGDAGAGFQAAQSTATHPGADPGQAAAPPAPVVNTEALHADRDRHSGGRGHVGCEGRRQRGLLEEPLQTSLFYREPRGEPHRGLVLISG